MNKLAHFLANWLLMAGGLLVLCACAKAEQHYELNIREYPGRRADFSLWQLEQFNDESQMGYLLRTEDNQLIMIDGGTPKSSEYVEDYLMQLGGRVHYWIITHPHNDHIGVLAKILKNPKLTVDKIIHTAVDLNLVANHEPASLDVASEFYSALGHHEAEILDARVNDEFILGDGVKMRVLGVRNNHITTNYINNSSLVFKIESSSKSVLFLGDLGIEGGNIILNGPNAPSLRSMYVQMAHHGQAGVSREFYAAVQPRFAFWPTPLWLWDNNFGLRGPNTGTWKTLTVREWMKELGVEHNYVAGIEGTVQID